MIPVVPFSPAFVLVSGALLSWMVAAAWRRFALRRQLVDQPGPRRLHQMPTPRGGGLGIALVLLACTPWLGQGGAAFAVGLVVTAGAGLVDDLRDLSALPKLLLQLLGAFPVAWAWPLAPELFGGPGSVAAALLVVIVLVNFWNFMDGSNGLAATQAMLVGVGLALVCGVGTPAGLLGLALAAGCLGFLPHNLPRARLFLGDVGSLTLGLAVAAAMLMALHDGQAGGWQLLLLPSAFLVDAGLTLAGRIWRREKFWRAHRGHLYQRAVAHGWSHLGICGAYLLWTSLAVALAWALDDTGGSLQMTVALALFAAGILTHLLAGRRWPREGKILESVE